MPDHAFGHVRLAYALQELKRTKEAWNTLLPAARDWLAQAFRFSNAKEIKLQAIED